MPTPLPVTSIPPAAVTEPVAPPTSTLAEALTPTPRPFLSEWEMWYLGGLAIVSVPLVFVIVRVILQKRH
jgi:hypothetical protein